MMGGSYEGQGWMGRIMAVLKKGRVNSRGVVGHIVMRMFC